MPFEVPVLSLFKIKRLNRFWDLGFRIPQGSVKRVRRRITMPLPSSSPPLFKVWIQPQRLEYSECIARYTHTSNETFCLLRIAVRSHMRRWQHGWAYSRLSAFPLLLFSPVCLFSFSPLSLSLLSITQPHPLHILLRFSPPLRWPSKTECPVLSVCHCLPAQEYQWPAAQSNQFLRGRSTVCLTSASLIIVSKHKPINSSQHLRLPTTKTPASYLKPPVFKALRASSTAVWDLSPIETWMVASEWFLTRFFFFFWMNWVVRRGLNCTVLK